MVDLRDDNVVRASYLSQLLDVEGTDLKRVYEPISNQIGYVSTAVVLLMVAYYAWTLYKKWRDERASHHVPYKVVKPPSSLVTEQEEGKKKRVCAVVGGTGFIGSRIVDELVRRKTYHVYVLGRTFRPERTNPDADCLIQVDNLDLEGLVSALQGVDSVINAAAIMPSVFMSADDVYSKNRMTYGNIIKAAKRAGVKHLVHISGYHMRNAYKFKDPLFRAFMNAFYKSEEDFVAANGEDGLTTVAICPPNIVGSNSFFFDKLISGEMTSSPMSDLMPVSFMPVEYLSTALVNAEEILATPSRAASIAGKTLQLRGEPMSWKTLFTLPGWPQKISPMSSFVMNVLVSTTVAVVGVMVPSVPSFSPIF